MLSRIAKELSSEGTKAVLVHGNADMDALGSAYAIARCFPGCAIFAPDGLDRVSKMVAAKTETAVREGLGRGSTASWSWTPPRRSSCVPSTGSVRTS